MISRTTTVSFVTFAIAAVVAMTGCYTTTMGNASKASEPTSTGTTGAVNSNPFGTLKACQVLDQLLAGQGFDPGDNQNARNECTTSKIDFGAYSIALDPTRDLTDFEATNAGATQTVVNGRKAMQVKPTRGMCVYALEVGQNALALVLANMADPRQGSQSCPSAKQLAEKLEPLLPQNQ